MSDPITGTCLFANITFTHASPEKLMRHFDGAETRDFIDREQDHPRR